MRPLQEAVEKLQTIMEVFGKYSVHVSPTLKNGELQYCLMYADELTYAGTEKEVIAFIDGAVYAELA